MSSVEGLPEGCPICATGSNLVGAENAAQCRSPVCPQPED